MWHVVAEEDMKCTECSHKISAGAECLSQLPMVMPEGFRRRKYENFCVECVECDAKKDQPPCFARRLDHWYSHEVKTSEAVPCANCERVIPKGARAAAQSFYVWPDASDSESEERQTSNQSVGKGVRAAGVAFGGATKRAQSGVWQNLNPRTRWLFRRGGLGGKRGIRSPAMARRLYENSVPSAIRNQGEAAVLNFLKGKQFSHIKSVANAPNIAKAPSNVVLEEASKNIARGSRNMTAAEVAATKTSGRIAAAGSVARGAAKGGAIAAAIEAPVTGLENFFHWKRGRKSRSQATKDAAKDVAVAGVAGAGATVVAAGVAKGAALVGVGLSLGPLGIPVAIGGGALLAGVAVRRVVKAAKRDLPLDEYQMFFCKGKRCKTRFARDVTKFAL